MTRTEGQVAICIGTYNQAQYLKGAIQSALAQTYPVNAIWVSDDCSTDDTAQVMSNISKLDHRIRYYRQPKNLGLPGNLSWLLSQPTTDLIVRLDSDDRLEPEYVAVLTSLMQQYPEAGFAHCDVYELDQNNYKTRVRRLAPRNKFESSEAFLMRNASGFRVAANCIIYRTQALKDCNYYYPNIGWRFSEDWDLCLRIAANGWANVYAPQPLANYRVWNDSSQIRARRKMAEVATTIDVYQKTLEPEFLRRGWNTKVLQRERSKRAAGYAEALDSPLFTTTERKEYKQLLQTLGNSYRLDLAISLAEHGLNPLVRVAGQTKVRIKDGVKSCMRLLSPSSSIAV